MRTSAFAVCNLVMPSLAFPFFAAVCLASARAIAGRIATPGQRAPIHLIALSTSILPSGLGMIAVLGGRGGAFVARASNVLVAAYAVGAVSIPEFWRRLDAPCEPGAR